MSRILPIQQFLNKANSSIKSNDYNDARYYFDKVLAIDSYNEEAIVGKAYCLYHLGDEDFAHKLCCIVSKDNLNNNLSKFYSEIMGKESFFKEAYDAIILNQFDAAKFYFNQILDLESENENAKVGKAYCFYCSGNISFARTLCSLVKINNLNPVSFNYYTKIMGNTEEKFQEINFSKEVYELFKRVDYSINRWDYKEAIVNLDEILTLEPENDNAIILKAYIFYKLEGINNENIMIDNINKGNLTFDNLKYYDELFLSINSKSNISENNLSEDFNYNNYQLSSLIKKGFNNLSQRNYNIANTYFKKALRLDSKNDDALLGKCYCLYKFDDDSHSKRIFKKINMENLSHICQYYYNILLNKYPDSFYENFIPEGKKCCPKCGNIVNDYDVRCVSCNHYFEDDYLLDNEKNFLKNVSCEEGFKLINKKEYARALLRFNKLLEYNSEDVLSILGKAICYQNLEKHEEALELCNHALDIFSDIENYDMFNNLVSEINESISIKYKNKKCPSCGKPILKDSIWCTYCSYYFKEKDHEYYLKQDKLDMYLLLNSRNRYSSLDDYVDILHWGYVYSLRRNLDNAMICINQILEFYPHNPNYLYDKAIVFYKMEKYDDTLMLIERVRNIDKSIVNDEWYEDLCKLGKEDLFKNLINNARKASLKEDFKSALSYYNQALIFEPHNIYVLNNKAHTLLYLEDYAEAIKIFDEVLEIDFEYIDALLGKSHALYYSNKYKEALTCLNKIHEIFDGFIDYEFYNDLFEKAENE